MLESNYKVLESILNLVGEHFAVLQNLALYDHFKGIHPIESLLISG